MSKPFIYPLPLGLPSRSGHCRALSSVPCTIQYVPTACMLSCFSCVPLFATPWIIARQAPLFIGFSMNRILEWVTVLSFRGSFPSMPYLLCLLHCRQLTDLHVNPTPASQVLNHLSSLSHTFFHLENEPVKWGKCLAQCPANSDY